MAGTRVNPPSQPTRVTLQASGFSCLYLPPSSQNVLFLRLARSLLKQERTENTAECSQPPHHSAPKRRACRFRAENIWTPGALQHLTD